MKKWLTIFLAVVLLSGCTGKQETAPSDPVKSGSEEVQLIWMSTIFPEDEVPKPLYPDRDAEKITQILAWIDQAKPAPDGEKLSLPRRAETIQVVLKQGDPVVVQPAWSCTSVTNGMNCTSAKDRVIIQHGSGAKIEYFESADLYAFFQSTSNEWMPRVQRFHFPGTVSAGKEFVLTGDGWVDPSVKIELADNSGKAYWSGESKTDHGHFSIKGTIPQDMPPGAHMFNVKSNSGSYGRPVQVLE